MNIYLGADWHFSININGRLLDFRLDPMKNDKILKNYVKTIKNDDVFIFLGDLTHFGTDNPEIINKQISLIKKLKGKKFFIKGNHDKQSNDFYLNTMNFDVCRNRLKIGRFIFTHYPVKLSEREIKEGIINIHAHMHGKKDYENYKVDPINHVDCYTNSYDFKPITLKEALYSDLSFVNHTVSEEEIRNLYTKLINY